MKGLADLANRIISEQDKSFKNGCLPLFMRLKKAGDKKHFAKLLKEPGIRVFDSIKEQVSELIKVRNPRKKFEAAELEAEVKKRLGTNPLEYGVWLYYPWSRRLVHLLDKKEFIEVRTSRNVYKITPAERETLSRKKIGVVGLSVGQSVSVTLAMERVCGEIRLADFDVLELTNLNRIRTGVHNLNLNKAYSVAREIAEIDPYIKVKCFTEGLNEKNMNRFFNAGGRLDLLVEESDGFDIKILCRYKARELGVPVLMEASDRCMVDVERFDLEPKRSILHGLVDHLKMDELKKLKTTEEKIPYMIDILGLDSSSLRLRASMLEIEQSINTWPQLASAVTMGGGITTDVARRILLNQYHESGRYYVDVEEIIGNRVKSGKEKKVNDSYVIETFPETSFNLNIEISADSLELTKEQVDSLVFSACLAPSGGNSQPWRWVYKNKMLFLFNPFKAGQTLLDFNSTASLIANGAALENLITHAAHLDLQCRIKYFPDQKNESLLAAIDFLKTNSIEKTVLNRFGALGVRHTNRTVDERTLIEHSVLNDLRKAALEIEGAELDFITDSEKMKRAGEILGELEKIRLLDQSGHRDFVNEMRWSREEAENTRDGVDIRTVDLTNSELVGFKIARQKQVIDLVNEWGEGGAFSKFTRKAIEGAGAIGILSMNGDSKLHYLKAGMALEKIWLEASRKKVAFHPVSACLFLYIRLYEGKGAGLEGNTCSELARLRPAFERLFCRPNNRKEMFIFRLTNCGVPEVRSLRRPLRDLLSYHS